jgi:uncharacterized protein DUF6113
VRFLTYLLLAVAGLAVGVTGAFVHHLRLHLGAVTVPYGLLLALTAGAVAGIAGGLLTHSRLGAGMVAGPWLLSALPFSTQRPEGDLIIAGTPAGYAYLLGTAVLAAMTVALPYRDLRPSAGGDDG